MATRRATKERKDRRTSFIAANRAGAGPVLNRPKPSKAAHLLNRLKSRRSDVQAGPKKKLLCFDTSEGAKMAWKPVLILGVVCITAGQILGLAFDAVVYSDVWIYYSVAFPIFAIGGWFLIAVRVVIIAHHRGDEHFASIFDFLVFLFLFGWTHYLAGTLVDLNYEHQHGRMNSQLIMTNQLVELVVNEEFTPEATPNMYKGLKDIASVEEAYQWLQGPFRENVATCSEDATYVLGLSPTCTIGDSGTKLIRWGQIRVRTTRIVSEPCGIGTLDGRFEDGKACERDVKDDGSNVDREPWTLDFSPCAAENAPLGLATGPVTVPYLDGTYFNFAANPVHELPDYGHFATYPAGGQSFIIPDKLDNSNIMSANDVNMTAAPLFNASNPGEAADFAARRKRQFFACLEKVNFIDKKTRLVVIEANVMNMQTIRYAGIQIVLEFSALGAVVSQVHMHMNRLPQITCAFEVPVWDPSEWFLPRGPCKPEHKWCLTAHERYVSSGWAQSTQRFCPFGMAPPGPEHATKFNEFNHESLQHAFEPRYRMNVGLPFIDPSALAILISTVIVPYFLIQEVEEMISIGLLKYIVSFWNWVDLSIVMVFLFGVLFNKVSQQQHTPLLETTTYMPYNTANRYGKAGGVNGIIMLLLLWVKLFKYFDWVPQVSRCYVSEWSGGGGGGGGGGGCSNFVLYRPGTPP